MSDGSKPDFIIYMPEDRCIILDSKVPLSKLAAAFEEGIDAELQASLFKEHKTAVRTHITNLSNSNYSSQNVPGTEGRRTQKPVEYTVMVVPEYALGPVMDTEMINFAQKRGIILVTPSMAVFVANVIHMMWKNQNISQNIMGVIDKASDLEKVISEFSDHYGTIGTTIDTLTKRYNKGKKQLDEAVTKLSDDLSIASSTASMELSESESGAVGDEK